MSSIETQAFNYKRNHKGCKYVITSNFEKLRFYAGDYSVDYEEFNFFTLKNNFNEFKKFYGLLSPESLLCDLPNQLKNESFIKEIEISNALYKDYLEFKTSIFEDLIDKNKNIGKIALLKYSQKIFDRLLFILFAEDRGLIPPNTLHKVIREYSEMKEKDEYKPLYYFLKKYFSYIDIGCVRNDYRVTAYNGELFKPDSTIDVLSISDDVLISGINKLSSYDFLTEIDIDILGHIFENSLSDIEEMQSKIDGIEYEEKEGKRKKDGVFYTRKYITQYIVNNTLGVVCEAKKKELGIDEITLDLSKEYIRLTKDKKILLHNILLYRAYLLSLKIVDPACGSGAFLIQAMNLLINEHQYIEQYRRVLEGDTLGLWEIEKQILENNLYGVDINEEAVEIAKLSLWLRTAESGRKLNNLASFIKCGNSLIDDKQYDPLKAFSWEDAFPEVFSDGGFDVVIGNPPYVRSRDNRFDLEKSYYNEKYILFSEKPNLYVIFMEKAISLLKEGAYFGFIVPNSWLGIESVELLRKYLIENMCINSIINLLGESFPGVGVETSIIIYSKRKQIGLTKYQTINEEGISFSNFSEISQFDWLKNRSSIIDLKSVGDENILLNRIISASFRLEEKYNVFVGLQAYEQGKGKPKQTKECVKNHIFDYDFQYDETTYKYLNGSDVERYSIKWTGQYLRYGEWLSQPRDLQIFNSPRILIREITSSLPYSLVCTYIEELYLNNKSILNILEKDTKFKLKYLLAILNSKLISFFLARRAVKGNRKLFPKVVAEDLKNIPIVIAPIEKQNDIGIRIDNVIALHEIKNKTEKRLFSRLISSFRYLNINNLIRSFSEIKFSELITELKKQKVNISLKEQDEWEEYFNECKQEVVNIKRKIVENNIAIDKEIYAIYNLSINDIKVIENSE